MKSIKIGLFLLVGISLNTNYIQSQTKSLGGICAEDCFCGSNPAPGGVMISHVHPKNEWMLSYRYMNMGMDGVLSGSTKIDEMDVFDQYIMNSNAMKMNMHMIMGMYGITNRLTAMAMFTYNVNAMEMSMLTEHDHSGGEELHHASTTMDMKTNGVGDGKLYLLHGVIKKVNHQLVLGTGINLPIGSINEIGTHEDVLYEERRLPYMMQLGSGTVDLLPSLTYTYQKGKLAFSSQIQGVIRSSYNSIGYKYGNEESFTSWISYNYWSRLSSSIRIEAVNVETMKGRDEEVYTYNEITANPANYGGQKVNLYLGMNYAFQSGKLKNNHVSIEYGLPIYQYLNGIQIQSKQAFTASWSYVF